jgi:hexulose-6-phosphate isomerase
MKVTRRSFLLGTGGALAAGAVGVPAARPAARVARAPRRSPKKAVKLGMVDLPGSYTERFKRLKELGFDGIEVESPSKLGTDEIRAACEASGIVVHGVVDAVHWNQPLSDPDPAVRRAGVDALQAALHDAKELGASTVLLVPGVVRKEVSYAECWQRSSACIRECLPVAQDCGVKIAIENVWNQFLLSPLEATRYLDQFDSAWIGAYFDVGNVVAFGWPEHWIESLGARILKVDVKGYSRKKRNENGMWKGFDVGIGEGGDDCDWPIVMKALDAIGYDGWFTAEVQGGGAERLAAIGKSMDRVLQS